ncbi:MAG TPA: serine/threonine-protein kinase, partial [Polyangiaceae bacterium]
MGADRLVGLEIGGKYKIVSLLGEGGMGCVYKGEQKLGNTIRKVAIKTLHEHLSHDPQILARFEREVGTVAGLQHPNTIQVFDFGKMDDGTLYIVMEFVEGKSVAGWLETTGAMEPARVVNILKQVCGSLEEAHGLGIVHRDLKPDNVVLCDKAGQHDWVEVLDFGIAKRSNETDEKEHKLTQQGMVLGTPPYMSPEQFTGQPIDVRTDIYALGVMAYEMLSGRLPWEANTAWEWASKHMTEEPTPLERQPLGPNVPESMRSAIARALAKDKNARFASVRE